MELGAFSRDVVCVLGLPFDVIGLQGAVAMVREAVNSRRPLFVSTPNLNFAIMARSDAAFRNSVLAGELSLADGIPIVWIARSLGLPLVERVPGAGLFEALHRTDGPPTKVYFFGGDEGVAEAACRRVNSRAGGLRCVGFQSPGFVSLDEMSQPANLAHINAASPDFLVVSLGAKKGQAWIERNRGALDVPVISHLGAVVNFAAGTIRRAPAALQRSGLEWLWRVKEEPKLWRRYASDAAAFTRILVSEVVPLWMRRFDSRMTAAPAPTIGWKTRAERCLGGNLWNLQRTSRRRDALGLCDDCGLTHTADHDRLVLCRASGCTCNRHVHATASASAKSRRASPSLRSVQAPGA